jgi:hypothetical protein
MPALDSLSRVAEVSFTIAHRAGALALSTARQVAGMAFDRRSQSRAPSTWAPPPPVSSRPASSASPREAPTPGPVTARAVDREATVVAESADAGAAGGAGAQIRIAEPWKGYGSLTAKEVNRRLATESPEALAVARLYEAANRNRVTVLKEIDHRLSTAGR